jgi:hypothetical protein
MSQLFDLLESMVYSDDKLALCRDELKVDAERIFDSIDGYRMGHVSMCTLSGWVLRNCGYELLNDDLARLQRKLDGGDDHRVGKESFVLAISAVPEEKPVASKTAAAAKTK